MSRTYNHKKPGYGGTTWWWKKWTRRQYRNYCRQLLRDGVVEFPPYRKMLVFYMGHYD